jgi:hypothetical protein
MSTQTYRRSVATLLIWLLMVQIACRGWIEKPIVPDTGIAVPDRGVLRVTRTDGAVVSLRDAFIANDTIFGFLATDPLTPAAIARADVKKIEVRGNTTPEGVRIAAKVYWVVLLGLDVALLVLAIMIADANNKLHR